MKWGPDPDGTRSGKHKIPPQSPQMSCSYTNRTYVQYSHKLARQTWLRLGPTVTPDNVGLVDFMAGAFVKESVSNPEGMKNSKISIVGMHECHIQLLVRYSSDTS